MRMPIDRRDRARGLILSAAVARLSRMNGGRGGEWARAMAAEAEVCGSGRERLGWVLGCFIASLRAPGGMDGAIYPMALIGGLTLMASYEWLADESLITVALLSAIALGLGALRPKWVLLSGSLIGLAVTGVLAFEVFSGLHPAYEAPHQTLGHSLHWLIFIAPGLVAAALGGGLGRWLRTQGVGR